VYRQTASSSGTGLYGSLLPRGGFRQATVVIGDGANDLSMFAHADTCIAFNAREVLRREATHCIDVKDLSLILDIVRG